MEKYTGKVFVVLKKDTHMTKVIGDEGDNLIVRFCKAFCGCFFDTASLWEFRRAPEPSDINWQNMGVGMVRRCCQTGFVWFVTIIILIVCAVIIDSIKRSEDKVKKEAQGKKLSDSEKT